MQEITFTIPITEQSIAFIKQALQSATIEGFDTTEYLKQIEAAEHGYGIAALKEAAPGVRILMLTVSENEDDLAAALQAGADGYLLKTVESDQLCDAIVKVLAGESVISPEMMTKFVAVFRAKGPTTTNGGTPAPAPANSPESGMDTLSAREREILAFIARGDSNKVIARALDIAETTVKVHVQHILRKLQLTSRVQVAVYAAGRGMI